MLLSAIANVLLIRLTCLLNNEANAACSSVGTTMALTTGGTPTDAGLGCLLLSGCRMVVLFVRLGALP